MSLHAVVLALEIGRLALVPIRELPVPVNWHLIQRRGRQINPAADAFQHQLNQRLPDLDEKLRALLRQHVQNLPEGV